MTLTNMEYTLHLKNLTCDACYKVCSLILKKIDGVIAVDIEKDGSTKITSTKPLDLETARVALKEKGYESTITS